VYRRSHGRGACADPERNADEPTLIERRLACPRVPSVQRPAPRAPPAHAGHVGLSERHKPHNRGGPENQFATVACTNKPAKSRLNRDAMACGLWHTDRETDKTPAHPISPASCSIASHGQAARVASRKARCAERGLEMTLPLLAETNAADNFAPLSA
jgi:hypothetical protein